MSIDCHAVLADAIDVGVGAGHVFVGVTRGDRAWPDLVVAQPCDPAGQGFTPGVAIVPEAGFVAIGAGTRLLGYR